MQITTVRNLVTIDNPLRFGRLDGEVHFGRGWSYPEHDFCWTEGTFSEIAIELSQPTDLIWVDCAPLQVGARQSTPVLVFANGRLATAEVISRRARLGLSINSVETKIGLLFWVTDVRSPAELDSSLGDGRQLGLRVFEIGCSEPSYSHLEIR